MRIPARHLNAFTLVELAVVITIIGLVTAMSVSSGISIIETARVQQTQDKMAVIKKALLAYRKAYNRMPCPSNLVMATTKPNFGIEGPNAPASVYCKDAAADAATANTLTAANDVVEGGVPVRSLGLPDDMAFDGWKNRIRYAVSTAYTVTNAFTNYDPGDNCTATLKVFDGLGTASTNYRTQSAVYVLISHGSDGLGSYDRLAAAASNPTTANQQRNCHCAGAYTTYDGTYVQASLAEDSTNYFDDIVEHGMRFQLQSSAETSTSVEGITPYGIVAVAGTSFAANGLAFLTVDNSNNFKFLPLTTLPNFNPGSSQNYYPTWSPHGTFLALFNPVDANLRIYRRRGAELGRLASGVWQAGVAEYTDNLGGGADLFNMAWSPNGRYLALTLKWSGPLKLYKNTGGDNWSSLASLGTPNPYWVNWVANSSGTYLLSPNRYYKYHGSGDTFDIISAPFNNASGLCTGAFSTPSSPITFSPDGTYATHLNGAGKLKVYKYNGSGTYVCLREFVAPNTSFNNNGVIQWAPNGKYFAFVYWDDPNRNNIVYVYKVAPSDVITALPTFNLPLDSGRYYATALSWTADSATIGMSVNVWTDPGLYLYHRVCDNFSQLPTFRPQLSGAYGYSYVSSFAFRNAATDNVDDGTYSGTAP